jgi:hypothetical protein
MRCEQEAPHTAWSLEATEMDEAKGETPLSGQGLASPPHTDHIGST